MHYKVYKVSGHDIRHTLHLQYNSVKAKQLSYQ